MSEAFIVRRGGGGTGATLTVTAPEGATVTITNGDKSHTKNGPQAVFKGLSSGLWRIIISKPGEQDIIEEVQIKADYTIELSFFRATINITYPAGSSCTCTDGTTTLAAPDTSGSWECHVPSAGTWTVTATDGSKTKSQNVTIATDGQVVSVALSYTLYLFKAGSGFQNGYGWNLWQTNHKPTNNNNYINLNPSGTSESAGFVFTPKVDLTNYSKLYFDVHTTDKFPAYNTSTILGISTNTTFDTSNFNGSVAQPVGSRSTKVLDISKFSGSYYIKVFANLTTGYLYNCWLE